MDGGAQILLTLSGLVLAALAAAAAGERVGAPLLLVFLAVGVLAGPEGPGGIVIENPDAAFTAASAALAVILVDGGLRTRPETLAKGARPGLALATFGTFATAAVTALAARAAFGVGWQEALLLGAVVSSTDAAAVFAVIGAAGAKVRPRLASTLEVESGVNDPAAVFLTLALAGALARGEPPGVGSFVLSFGWQALGGLAIGAGAGFALARVTPRLKLAAGLRPILILAGGLFAFALAQSVGASGFLAAYVCGVVHARRDRGVVEAEARALDGFAWLAQLALFLILGLLATPSHIVAVAGPAIAVALALTLVARPIAVLASLAPFRIFSWNERLFAAWAGLRGATPIFLGLAPAALGAPNANLYVSVAFVVVGLSLIAQGWTTPIAARLLGVSGDEEADRGAIRIGGVRGAAVAGAVAASVAVAIVIARVAAPAPVLMWTPATVAELETGLERRTSGLVAALPPDWDSVTDTERRKRLFIGALAPLVEAENARVRAERAEVEGFRAAEAGGRTLSLAAQGRRDVLARRYDADYADFDALLAHIDAVPASLVVAHAAQITGWGASAPAREANALFGQRPGEDADDPDRYATLSASVADYIRTLNRHPDFAAFRAARAAARAEGRTLSGAELAAFVGPFAADGAAFASQVGEIIASNDLARLDGRSGAIAPAPAAPLR